MTRFFKVFSIVALIALVPIVASAATLTLTPVYSGSFSGDGNNTSLGIVPQFQHQIGEILEFDVYATVNNLLTNENFTGVSFNVSSNANLVPVDPFNNSADWYSPAQAKTFAPTGGTTGPYPYRTFPNSGTSSGGTPLNSYTQYRGDTTTTASTSLFNSNVSISGNNDLNSIAISVGRSGANQKIDAFNRNFGQVFNPPSGSGVGELDQLRAAGSQLTLIGTFFEQFVNDDGSTTAGGAAHPGTLQVVPTFNDAVNTTWTTLQNNSATGGGTQKNYFGQFANNVGGTGSFFGGSVTIAPEPASFVLLGLGGVAMALASRRRVKKA